jgi:hypothetical protein
MMMPKLVVGQHVLLVVVRTVVGPAETANLRLAWELRLSRQQANHSNGWDAKRLAYVLTPQNLAAGLPATHSTS